MGHDPDLDALFDPATIYSDPLSQERDRLRLIAFVAYGALKALHPENEVTKWVEEALWPKPLILWGEA